MHESEPIETIAIIGAGTMGSQIAALAACGGRQVSLHDADSAALDRGMTRIDREILPAIECARPGSCSAADGRSRIQPVADLAAAVAGAQLVIEAVREDAAVKRGVFAELSRLAPAAILATNSSSLPSSVVADVVADPRRLLNMHFFAPVWVRTMVELMTCGSTADDTFDRVLQFCRSLGLTAATARVESRGFIINRIWRAVKRESLRVVDEGVATPEDVDRLWMTFFQTVHAPFGLMDMVGLDVVRDIEAAYQRDTRDPTDTPSATLLGLIQAGRLGEKTGAGFYTHPHPSSRRPDCVGGDAADQAD